MGRLIVAYSPGAVLLRDLAVGVDWCTAVLFVVRPDLDARARSLLEHLGEVVTLDGADLDITGSAPGAEAVRAARAFEPDGIVTFSEDLLAVTSRLAGELGLRSVPERALPSLLDKAAQRAVLRAAAVEELRTATVRDRADWATAAHEVGLPLVLKPARGAGSRDTVRVDSVEEGAAHVRAVLGAAAPGPLVAEEFLVGRPSAPFGDYVSVESLVVEGRVHHLGVTGKMPQLHPFRETAQFFPSLLGADDERDVLELCTRALDALGLDHAMTHTEIKLTSRGPRIIEVNGRAGGYVNELYTRALGTDVVELVSRLACGERPPIPTADRGHVRFQAFHQPPLGARALRSVDGARTVARHACVSRLDRLVEPGTVIPDDGRSFDLDLVCGRAESHAHLVALLRELGEQLTFVFETVDGEQAFTGAALGPSS